MLAPRSTRRARNRWIHACGIEPSLHRDRINIQRSGNANVPKRIARFFLAGSVSPFKQTCTKSLKSMSCGVEPSPRRDQDLCSKDVHAIVEKSMSCGAEPSPHRDVPILGIQTTSISSVPVMRTCPETHRRRLLSLLKELHASGHRVRGNGAPHASLRNVKACFVCCLVSGLSISFASWPWLT